MSGPLFVPPAPTLRWWTSGANSRGNIRAKRPKPGTAPTRQGNRRMGPPARANAKHLTRTERCYPSATVLRIAARRCARRMAEYEPATAPVSAPQTPERKASKRGGLDKNARQSLSFFAERSLHRGGRRFNPYRAHQTIICNSEIAANTASVPASSMRPRLAAHQWSRSQGDVKGSGPRSRPLCRIGGIGKKARTCSRERAALYHGRLIAGAHHITRWSMGRSPLPRVRIDC